MSELNPQQRAAVRYLDGPLLVVAGAGSGKTRVIAEKIAYLIEQAGIAPRHIRALTFTNKAAREMRERVGQRLRGVQTSGLVISTFHRLGLEILRRSPEPAGLHPGFSLLDAEDAETLLKEVLHEATLPNALSPGAIKHQISLWKNDLIDPQQAERLAEDDFGRRLAVCYADYEQRLRAYNAVDFDDLILLPTRLFQEYPERLAEWCERIRYLLIDEYQDTNGAQYQLLRQLAGGRGAFTAVGDDDQSIYAWRGARPENLGRLKEDYPDLQVIMLEQNYRSTGRILGLANALIAHNPHLFVKRLWSAHGAGQPARVLPCRDETDEAERVVCEILHLRFAERCKLGEIAILFRGNHQARPFEQALRAHRLPYVLSGGTSFFARTEIKDILAYLRLLANPADDAAFLRVVNVPRRAIGPQTLARLAELSRIKGISLLAACRDPWVAAQLTPRQCAQLQSFARLLAEHGTAGDPIESLRALIQTIGYRAWLEEQAASAAAGERRYQNVLELLAWLERLWRDEFSSRGLLELVDHLKLLDVLDRLDEAEAEDRVHLLTIHAAKGLEFDHVFLVGMEEDLLPHRTSIEEGAIEEERRLAYVGITRARKTLTFTLAQRRRRAGELIETEPSRFLLELPPSELLWEGKATTETPDPKARGRAHLSALKAMLAAG